MFLLLLSLFLLYYYLDKAGTPFAPEIKDQILESRDCREIQVTWNPAPLQSGSPVTGYLAEAKEQSSSEWLNCTTPCGSSRQCTIKGLKSETDYIVRVSAKNSRGYGNPSPIKTIRTDPTGNLATIVGLNKISEDKGSLSQQTQQTPSRTDPTGNVVSVVVLTKISQGNGNPSPKNITYTIQDMSHK